MIGAGGEPDFVEGGPEGAWVTQIVLLECTGTYAIVNSTHGCWRLLDVLKEDSFCVPEQGNNEV